VVCVSSPDNPPDFCFSVARQSRFHRDSVCRRSGLVENDSGLKAAIRTKVLVT
jgi:hypothetical protein